MSHRLTKEELDEQFELFLKESVSDDSLDLGDSDKQSLAKSSQKSPQKTTVSWWQDDEHSGGGMGKGLLGSGKSFRKSLRKSQPIQEEDENSGDTGVMKEGLGTVVFNIDNTESEAVHMISMGLDTLEEEEEKAKFFAQLEAGTSSAINYSKLNRELDSTTSAIGSVLRKTEGAVEQSDDDQSRVRVAESIRISQGSPHYSEDFEAEENGNEQLKEKSKISSILAKVSLYDSLDDTGREDIRKDKAGSLNRGLLYVQSGGSEMEALHEAYRQIHVAEDSQDHNHHYSSLEERGTVYRHVSPASLPLNARQSLQLASTNDSELPTAEELMRPIRPEKDHIRGFTLQPVRAVEPDQEKTSDSLERTVSEETYTKSQLTRPDQAETERLMSHPSSSPKPFNHDLPWNIREEVKSLMQDHKSSSSYTTAQAAKAKKQPDTRISTISHASTASVRKPTVPSVRGIKDQGKTAATSRSTGTSRAAAKATTHSSVSHSSQHCLKVKSSDTQEKDDSTVEPGLKVSSQLVASVQSLVAVLQQQIDTSSHRDTTDTLEVRGPQEMRLTHHLPNNNSNEENSLVEELRVQLAQKERELQLMKEGAEELNSLRQQNYLLQSKLRNTEEENQKNRWAEATDPATAEKLQQIDREMKEQETLIKGYQQENEKLYLQLKAQQAKIIANEEAMFNENQRLLNELAFTREQLNKISCHVGNVNSVSHTQRITDLLTQINTFQGNEAKLSEDIHRLEQKKLTLEVELQQMKKERDQAKAKAISTSGDQTFEMRVLEDKHREKVAVLEKKLQWFAENQELLDRDAGRLKAATAEIHKLKEQVEELKMEVRKRSSNQQRKAKEKSMDTKRMQDLERQVKELEQILGHRNPNSLPALIYAAARAGGQKDGVISTASPPSRINTFLERRIQRLEEELENHDEEAKHSLRAMEQQFHRIRLRYEQQISELEQQLQQMQQAEAASLAAGPKPWMSQVQTLQEELQQLKETHQEKEKGLRDQIESLQQQLKQKAKPSPGRHQRQAEAAFGVRIERLNQELAAKTRTIQELTRTVERLQKERRSSPRPETRSTETKRQPDSTCATAAETGGGEEMFPAAHYEKTYQPTVFTGSHISEVLQENKTLRQRLEQLQLQNEHEKEALQTEAIQAKEELCRLKDLSAEQLSSMKAEHLRVLDQLCAIHALEHSSSKVAELANKLSTQEVMVTHLQDQLKELQGAKNALAVSRTREDALQTQLTSLLKELKEAKEAQSLEAKLLHSLERKIFNMELRHQHRQKELQQVIGGSWQMREANQHSEVERWRRLAQDKNRELEAFRLELDSILDILRHLQKQGVVFPAPDTPIPPLTQRT